MVVVLFVSISVAGAAMIGDTLWLDPEGEWNPVVVSFGPTTNWIEVSPSAIVFYRWGDTPPPEYGPGSTWLYISGEDTVMYGSIECLGQGLYLVNLNAEGNGPFGFQVVDSENTPYSNVFSRISFPIDSAGNKKLIFNGQLTFVGEREPCEDGIGSIEVWLVHGRKEALIGGIRSVLLSGDGFALTDESKVIGRFAHFMGGPYLKKGGFLEALVCKRASGIGREVIRIDLL